MESVKPDASFREVKARSMLTEVNVTWCNKLTDITFQRLQSCHRLTRIGLKGCSVSRPVISSYEEKGLQIY